MKHRQKFPLSIQLVVLGVVTMCWSTDAIAQVSGNINLAVSASGGTQRRNDVSGQFDFSYEAGLVEPQLHRQSRLRLEGAYGTAQKPEQPKIVGTEWYYAEARQSFDAVQLFGGSRANRDTKLWLYGLASLSHQIAFDLDAQRALAVGLSYAVDAIPGLEFSADVRHLQQEFKTQSDFTSWGARLHQSYTHSWTVAAKTPGERVFVFSEVLEVTPTFKTKGALQARAGITLSVPLVRNWSMPISYGSDYMRNVPQGFKRHFWKTAVGITYALGG